MKNLFFLVAFLLSSNHSFSQDLPYARQILDTLCAPGMHGRGYVNNGDKIAANYIAGEFKRLGLEPISGNYFQRFSTPVNTFPGELSLKINNTLLVPGVDYLLEPGSPSLKGEFKVIILNEEDLLNEKVLTNSIRNSEGKFIIIDKSTKTFDDEQKKQIRQVINFFIYSDESPAAGTIILTHEKLTWGGSTEQNAKPAFTVQMHSVPSKITSVAVNIENLFIENYETQNIIGFIKGEAVPDTVITFIAHYDHLGRMGSKTYFPGANDNASGISMLLNLAKHYKQNPPGYSMLFIAFGAEEIGLAGSDYYTKNPVLPLENIKFLLNFDISGTGDDGIQVVNGSVFQKEFDLLTDINNKSQLLKEVKIRGSACNSDHCFFYEKGAPSFFIYTLGGIQAYHDIYDKAETLPFTEFENYFKLIVKFTGEL